MIDQPREQASDAGLRWTKDGFVVQALAPRSDGLALLRTVNACLGGIPGRVLELAGALFKGIGPVCAEAASIQGQPRTLKSERLKQENIEAAKWVLVDIRGRVTEREASDRNRNFLLRSSNFRNGLIAAMDEDDESAEVFKEGLRNINAITLVIPEASSTPRSNRSKVDRPDGAFDSNSGILYLDAYPDGRVEAGTLHAAFWGVREHFSPEVEELPEYSLGKISECHEQLKSSLFLPAEMCLQNPDPRSVDCKQVAGMESSFQSRERLWPCSADHTDDRGWFRPASNAAWAKGVQDLDGLISREVNRGGMCKHEPLAVFRNGVLQRLAPKEVEQAKLVPMLDDMPTEASLEKIVPPETLKTHVHGAFVKFVPRPVARKYCPDLFVDTSARKDKGAEVGAVRTTGSQRVDRDEL